MLLSTIIDAVKYGELQNVYTEEKLPQLISFINLGLIQIYSKLPIIEKQVTIQEYPQISLYKLSSMYARHNHLSSVRHKYILDTPDNPFMDDVLFITGISDEYGFDIPLNDEHHRHSIFISSYDTIQIPNANENEAIFVIYRAKPKGINPLIKPELLDKTEVILPDYLLEALTAFIGFKAHQAIGGQEGLAASQAFYQRFTELINQAIADNIAGDGVLPTNIKPRMRGYV